MKRFITHKGSIVDALFVEVTDNWKDDAQRLIHKNLDATRTKKNPQIFYGYKSHANDPMENNLIVRTEVTDAYVHDIQALGSVTCGGGTKTRSVAKYCRADL